MLPANQLGIVNEKVNVLMLFPLCTLPSIGHGDRFWLTFAPEGQAPLTYWAHGKYTVMFLISTVFDVSGLTSVTVKVPESPGTYDALSGCVDMFGCAWADCPSAARATTTSKAAMIRFPIRTFMVVIRSWRAGIMFDVTVDRKTQSLVD